MPSASAIRGPLIKMNPFSGFPDPKWYTAIAPARCPGRQIVGARALAPSVSPQIAKKSLQNRELQLPPALAIGTRVGYGAAARENGGKCSRWKQSRRAWQ